jgi:hypothetical protein
MSAKITLYSEPHLIDKVKQYAKQHNTSVSKMVTSFFETVVAKENKKKSVYAEKTSKLYGILKDTKFDKEDYAEYLEEKYL